MIQYFEIQFVQAALAQITWHHHIRLLNKANADYALRGLKTPIGVSSYQLTDELPTDLKSLLPTIEEIESHLKPKS